MQFEVRPRTEADLPASAAALRAVHESDHYPRDFPDDPLAWLCSPRQRQAWVAVTAGDAVVGHAGLNVAEGDPALAVFTGGTGLGPERLAVVSRLFVVAEAQRCGVATALLTAAASVAHAAGKRPVLDVLEADLGAITFYERAGWVRTGSILFRSPRTGQPLPAFVYAGPPPPSGRC